MPNPVLCLLLNCYWAPASLSALHTWTISAVKSAGSWYCSTLHFLNSFIYVAYILYSCGPQLLYIANSFESIYRFLFITLVLCIWWFKKLFGIVTVQKVKDFVHCFSWTQELAITRQVFLFLHVYVFLFSS